MPGSGHKDEVVTEKGDTGDDAGYRCAATEDTYLALVIIAGRHMLKTGSMRAFVVLEVVAVAVAAKYVLDAPQKRLPHDV